MPLLDKTSILVEVELWIKKRSKQLDSRGKFVWFCWVSSNAKGHRALSLTNLFSVDRKSGILLGAHRHTFQKSSLLSKTGGYGFA